MPTQTSQLISNLQNIYSEKLLIKQAIPTTSDNFMDYHTYIAALHPSGTSYISANGLSDVSSYQFAYVTVEGGGSGSSADPWYGSVLVNDMVENEETTADYYKSIISDNFSATAVKEDGEPTGEYEDISWDEIAEFEQEGGEPVEKIVHVVITGDPHEQSGTAGSIIGYNDELDGGLYGNIYPILENVTLTISEDPSEDGYDYLIEGDLYAWNLINCDAGVDTISENGFYPATSGYFGVTINVAGGDPLYGSVQVLDMIKNGDTTANYVQSMIYENFEYTEENDEYTISWDDKAGTVEGGQPVDKIIHVVLTGDPHGIYGIGSDIASAIKDYPSLYTSIYPVLENATVTESSNPSEDGYDYLLKGDLYAWNLADNAGPVDEIIGNGFHVNTGGVGFVIPQ